MQCCVNRSNKIKLFGHKVNVAQVKKNAFYYWLIGSYQLIVLFIFLNMHIKRRRLDEEESIYWWILKWIIYYLDICELQLEPEIIMHNWTGGNQIYILKFTFRVAKCN